MKDAIIENEKYEQLMPFATSGYILNIDMIV